MTPGDAAATSPPERFDLPADSTAAAVARNHARHLPRRWGIPGLLEPLSLVVSELVGNAVRHGRPPFELLLRKTGRGVRADVHDDAPELPPDFGRQGLASAGPDAESGRGLLMVHAISTDLGVEKIEGDGKRVWAVVEAAPDGQAADLAAAEGAGTAHGRAD